MTEAESFYDLKRDVERLSYGEEAELKDIIKRIKIAIRGTFGVEYDYLKQLENITLFPSINEATRYEYYESQKEKMLQDIDNIPILELRAYIEEDFLADNRPFPQRWEEMTEIEIRELVRQQMIEFSDSINPDPREKSWSSGLKHLLELLERILKHIMLNERDSDILKSEGSGRKLKISRGQDKLLEIKVTAKEEPNDGELDIIIKSNGFNFHRALVHQPEMDLDIGLIHHYQQEGIMPYNNVRRCSWHGYYEVKGSNRKYPLINLHDEKGNILNMDEGRHDSIVCQKDIIAVPVCSIQMPMELKVKDRFNRSEFAAVLDLFILPKDVSWKTYAKTFVYRMYCINEHTACFSPPMHGMLSGGLAENCIVDMKSHEFLLEEGQWDAIIRCIYIKDTSCDYSIHFYATCDPINYAVNRGICEGIDNIPFKPNGDYEPVEKQSIRDIHEKELRDLGLIRRT